MDDTTESDFHLKDSINGKNDETSDVLLRESHSTRSSIPKVSLRLPFKSESFKAQSLLARFHSSRKSESGIKNEIKTVNNGSGLGFGRGWNRHKQGHNIDVLHCAELEPENTSASLPDDLHQNSSVAVNVNSPLVGINVCRKKGDAPETSVSGCISEESPFLPPGGQRVTESWFDTWPGQTKKLKSLRKRLLASGTNKNNSGPINDTENHERVEDCRESSCLLPQNLNADRNEEFVLPRISDRIQDDIEPEMNSRLPELTGHCVSLDALLESLPLVYDPSTRQLCLGSSKKGQNESSNKRMSNTISDYDIHPEKQNLDSRKEYSVLNEKDEESQKEALLKTSDTGEATLPKPLEIIQEVDENGETVRLIDKSTPQSGNVSGSSSLERGNYESPRDSLQRVGTNNSLSITDASSFSSLSSSNTELSAYSASDSAVCLGSHQSDTGSLRDFVLTDNDGKTKKKGITDFLTR